MDDERLHLGFVEGVLVGALLAVGGQAAEVEVFRGFFDRHQAALDQGGQRGCGNAEFAQRVARRTHAAAGSGEFGEDGGLVVVEFGDARVGHQDGDALGAPGVALFGERLAEQPLLAHHGVEQRLAGLRRRAQGGGFGGVAVFQVVRARRIRGSALRRAGCERRESLSARLRRARGGRLRRCGR